MRSDPTSIPPPPGTAEDFTGLFLREREPMVRLATLLVGSVPAAEDVVQEAFVAVDTRWDQLDRPGAYLRTAVVNGCRAALRRQQVEQRHRGRVTPADVADIPIRLVELHDALQRLSERQRLVVVLRYFVDLPDREIAEALGARPSTVRSLARRALSNLRKELE